MCRRRAAPKTTGNDLFFDFDHARGRTETRAYSAFFPHVIAPDCANPFGVETWLARCSGGLRRVAPTKHRIPYAIPAGSVHLIWHDSRRLAQLTRLRWEVICARQALKFMQTEFADLLGVSRRTLENWEQGRTLASGEARMLITIARIRPKAVRDAQRYLMQAS